MTTNFHSTLLAENAQHALLNLAVLVAVLVPSVALGLAIRRARQQKAARDSDPNAPMPRWVALAAGGLQLADFRTRLAALTIDVVTVIVVWAILRAGIGSVMTREVIDGTFLVAYYSLGNGFGGALGARVMHVKLVLANGSRPGLIRGTVRHLMSYPSGLLIFGYLSQIWDESGQTWHDKLSGTYVVRRPMRKSRNAALAAAEVPTSHGELQTYAAPTAAQGLTSHAETEDTHSHPAPPRGEHEPGCTRKHSTRQRCTTVGR